MEASEEKKYVCTFEGCGMRFLRPSRLNTHRLIHTPERPFKCEEPGCDKAYARAQHLSRHFEQVHSPEKVQPANIFFCSENGCKQSFALKQSLKKHLFRQHSDYLPYKCDEKGCEEAFRKKHQLRAHVFQHKGILPFQCDFEGCLKRFAQSSHLQRHQKQHLGYTCKEEGCDGRFDKWSQLRKHVATNHTKTFPCTNCGERYPSRPLLLAHEKSHGANPEVTLYRCPIENCPRRYAAMRNLTAHVKSYHENKHHACVTEGCNKKFATKQKMLEHQKQHNPNIAIRKKKSRKKIKNAVAKLVTAICGKDLDNTQFNPQHYLTTPVQNKHKEPKSQPLNESTTSASVDQENEEHIIIDLNDLPEVVCIENQVDSYHSLGESESKQIRDVPMIDSLGYVPSCNQETDVEQLQKREILLQTESSSFSIISDIKANERTNG